MGFSIIVPFKNEEDKLPDLIAHLKNIHYPLKEFEVIFVDDGSSDSSVKILQAAIDKSFYPVMRLLTTRESSGLSGKKMAIHTGVSNARYEYIITIDADCTMGSHWLQTYATYISENHPDMIIGPVEMVSTGSLLSDYFALEFSSLVGSAFGAARIGMPVMCNGANLVYRKETYERVGGFSGNLQYASGDDVFLLHKFKKLPEARIHPLKSPGALVYTNTPKSFGQFFRQRKRWSAKSLGYTDSATLWVGGTVAAFSLSIAAGIVAGIFSPQIFKIALLALVVKIIVDFPLLWMVLGFTRRRLLLWLYPSLAVLYPFYVSCTLAIAILPFRGWKK